MSRRITRSQQVSVNWVNISQYTRKGYWRPGYILGFFITPNRLDGRNNGSCLIWPGTRVQGVICNLSRAARVSVIHPNTVISYNMEDCRNVVGLLSNWMIKQIKKKTSAINKCVLPGLTYDCRYLWSAKQNVMSRRNNRSWDWQISKKITLVNRLIFSIWNNFSWNRLFL